MKNFKQLAIALAISSAISVAVAEPMKGPGIDEYPEDSGYAYENDGNGDWGYGDDNWNDNGGVVDNGNNDNGYGDNGNGDWGYGDDNGGVVDNGQGTDNGITAGNGIIGRDYSTSPKGVEQKNPVPAGYVKEANKETFGIAYDAKEGKPIYKKGGKDAENGVVYVIKGSGNTITVDIGENNYLPYVDISAGQKDGKVNLTSGQLTYDSVYGGLGAADTSNNAITVGSKFSTTSVSITGGNAGAITTEISKDKNVIKTNNKAESKATASNNSINITSSQNGKSLGSVVGGRASSTSTLTETTYSAEDIKRLDDFLAKKEEAKGEKLTKDEKESYIREFVNGGIQEYNPDTWSYEYVLAGPQNPEKTATTRTLGTSTASNNNVKITGSIDKESGLINTTAYEVVGGIADDGNGTADSNTVEIKNVDVNGSVIGGSAINGVQNTETKDADGKVVSSTTTKGYVKGSASKNTVKVNNSIAGDVIGGDLGVSDVAGATITYKSYYDKDKLEALKKDKQLALEIEQNIAARVEFNKNWLDGREVTDEEKKQITEQTTDSYIARNLYKAEVIEQTTAYDAGVASENKVSITGTITTDKETKVKSTDTVVNNVIGGRTGQGKDAAANKNEVEIKDAVVKGDVSGGISGGKSDENKVKISGSTVSGSVVAGSAFNAVSDAETKDENGKLVSSYKETGFVKSSASKNTVDIKNSQTGDIIAGDNTLGRENAGATITEKLSSGGIVEQTTAYDAGAASENKVSITGTITTDKETKAKITDTVVGNVIGGRTGQGKDAAANKNEVEIKDAVVRGDVSGGISGGKSDENKVKISGSNVSGSVVAGSAFNAVLDEETRDENGKLVSSSKETGFVKSSASKNSVEISSSQTGYIIAGDNTNAKEDAGATGTRKVSYDKATVDAIKAEKRLALGVENYLNEKEQEKKLSTGDDKATLTATEKAAYTEEYTKAYIDGGYIGDDYLWGRKDRAQTVEQTTTYDAGDASGNTVKVAGKLVDVETFDAQGEKITVKAQDTTTGSIIGGRTGRGKEAAANSNTIDVANAIVNGSVEAGISGGKSADSNNITISGSKVDGSVIAGSVINYEDSYEETNENGVVVRKTTESSYAKGSASKNTVDIKNSQTGNIIAGDITGGSTTAGSVRTKKVSYDKATIDAIKAEKRFALALQEHLDKRLAEKKLNSDETDADKKAKIELTALEKAAYTEEFTEAYIEGSSLYYQTSEYGWDSEPFAGRRNEAKSTDLKEVYDAGVASENTVKVAGKLVDVKRLDENGKEITVQEQDTTTGSIIGGRTGKGKDAAADTNTITVETAIVNGNIEGGISGGKSANTNNISITGSKVNGSVIAGQVNNSAYTYKETKGKVVQSEENGPFVSGTANNSNITITDSQISGDVVGGEASNSFAENLLNFGLNLGATDLIGATTTKEVVYDQKLLDALKQDKRLALKVAQRLENEKVRKGSALTKEEIALYTGAETEQYVDDNADKAALLSVKAEYDAGTASNNNITVSGKDTVIGGSITAGRSGKGANSATDNNKVIVNDAEVQGGIIAGQTRGKSASNNEITLTNATTGSLLAADVSNFDGSATFTDEKGNVLEKREIAPTVKGVANDNTITITDSKVSGNIVAAQTSASTQTTTAQYDKDLMDKLAASKELALNTEKQLVNVENVFDFTNLDAQIRAKLLADANTALDKEANQAADAEAKKALEARKAELKKDKLPELTKEQEAAFLENAKATAKAAYIAKNGQLFVVKYEADNYAKALQDAKYRPNLASEFTQARAEKFVEDNKLTDATLRTSKTEWDSGDATGNKIIIDGKSEINANITAARVGLGNGVANNNSIEVKDGIIIGSLTAANTQGKGAEGNTITVSGGMTGGLTAAQVNNTASYAKTTDENGKVISDTVNEAKGGFVVGSANNNTIKITGGQVGFGIVGQDKDGNNVYGPNGGNIVAADVSGEKRTTETVYDQELLDAIKKDKTLALNIDVSNTSNKENSFATANNNSILGLKYQDAALDDALDLRAEQYAENRVAAELAKEDIERAEKGEALRTVEERENYRWQKLYDYKEEFKAKNAAAFKARYNGVVAAIPDALTEQYVEANRENRGRITNTKIENLSGDALNNKVIVSGKKTEVGGSITAAQSTSGFINENSVEVKDAKVWGSITAANGGGQGADKNTVVVEKGSVEGSITAANINNTASTTVNKNVDGKVINTVENGPYVKGSVTNNSITVNDSLVKGGLTAGATSGSYTSTETGFDTAVLDSLKEGRGITGYLKAQNEILDTQLETELDAIDDRRQENGLDPLTAKERATYKAKHKYSTYEPAWTEQYALETTNRANAAGATVSSTVRTNDSGDALNNSININGGRIATNGGAITAGSSGAGAETVANSNVINITGGTIGSTVYTSFYDKDNLNIATVNVNMTAGQTAGKAADANQVNISGGTVRANITAGSVNNEASTTTNRNILGNVANYQEVGPVVKGDATNNQVNITGGTITGSIVAGQTNGTNTIIETYYDPELLKDVAIVGDGSKAAVKTEADKDLRVATLKDALALEKDVAVDDKFTIEEYVIDNISKHPESYDWDNLANAQVTITRNIANSGNALNNTISIADATIFPSRRGSIVAGSAGAGADSVAANNTINIFSGRIGEPDYRNMNSNQIRGRENVVGADGNTLSIIAGETGGKSAEFNTVNVLGGTVKADITGGSVNNYADFTISRNDKGAVVSYTENGPVVSGTATNNTVNITGGTVKGSITGGSTSGTVDFTERFFDQELLARIKADAETEGRAKAAKEGKEEALEAAQAKGQRVALQEKTDAINLTLKAKATKKAQDEAAKKGLAKGSKGYKAYVYQQVKAYMTSQQHQDDLDAELAKQAKAIAAAAKKYAADYDIQAYVDAYVEAHLDEYANAYLLYKTGDWEDQKETSALDKENDAWKNIKLSLRNRTTINNSGDALNNTVNIQNATVTPDVVGFGGSSYLITGGNSGLGSTNTAANNTVNIFNSNIDVGGRGSIAGGLSGGKSAENNSVNIFGSNVRTRTIFGGSVGGTGAVGQSGATSTLAQSNVVNLFDTKVNAKEAIIGGKACVAQFSSDAIDFTKPNLDLNATATNNTVNVINSTVNAGYIAGGMVSPAFIYTYEAGDKENTREYQINLKEYEKNPNGLKYFDTRAAFDSNVIYATDQQTGQAKVKEVKVSDANATNNTVNLSGSKITGSVLGGASGYNLVEVKLANEKTSRDFVVAGNATHNTVNFLSGTVSGGIYGGAAVEVLDRPNTNTPHIHIYKEVAGKDYITGNTLNIGASQAQPAPMNQLKAENIYNFENINFYLPSDVKNGDTALQLTTTTEVTDLSKSTVSAYLDSAGGLNADSKINLIKTGGALTNPKATNTENVKANIANLMEVPAHIKVDSTRKALQLGFGDDKEAAATGATATKTTASGQRGATVITSGPAKLFLENKLTGVVAVEQGGDFLVDNLTSFKQGNSANAGGVEAWTFANVGGYGKKAKTGSHVDVRGTNLNFGVGVDNGLANGAFFVEHGNGSWDSELDNGRKDNGRTHYTGAGLFGQYNHQSGAYAEGSLRGGNVKTKSKGWGNYETSSGYFGVHVGGGYRTQINPNNELNVYGKFSHLNTGSDTLNNWKGTGVNVNVASVKSNSIKLGVKDTVKMDDNSSLYGGVAYKYAFNGKSKGTMNAVGYTADMNIVSPQLKGSSGILEAGYKYSGNNGFDFSIGAKGYVGKERGIGADAKVRYTFK